MLKEHLQPNSRAFSSNETCWTFADTKTHPRRPVSHPMKHLGTQGLRGTVGKLHSSNGCYGEHPRRVSHSFPLPHSTRKSLRGGPLWLPSSWLCPFGQSASMTDWRDGSLQRPGPFTSVGTTRKDFPSSSAPFGISQGLHCGPISLSSPVSHCPMTLASSVYPLCANFHLKSLLTKQGT